MKRGAVEGPFFPLLSLESLFYHLMRKEYGTIMSWCWRSNRVDSSHSSFLLIKQKSFALFPRTSVHASELSRPCTSSLWMDSFFWKMGQNKYSKIINFRGDRNLSGVFRDGVSKWRRQLDVYFPACNMWTLISCRTDDGLAALRPLETFNKKKRISSCRRGNVGQGSAVSLVQSPVTPSSPDTLGVLVLHSEL